MTEDNTPITQAQQEAIRLFAEKRRSYVLWLAAWLRSDAVPKELRQSAADELEQLVGGKE